MKYRIIHILAGKANPDTMNGVNRVVDALATEQHRAGYDVAVFGVASNTQKRHIPEYGYFLFTASRMPFILPAGLLDSLLEYSDTDTVFHFHSVFITWYLPLMTALEHHGRNRFFYTPHGGLTDESMKGLSKRLYYRIVEREVIRHTEAVQLMGGRNEDNAYAGTARRKVFIPNGITRAELSVPPEKDPVIGFLGRLECHQKGLDVLIPAFAGYKRQGGRCRLAIAGDGQDAAVLRRLVKERGVSGDVTFTGPLLGDGKERFIRSISAHILPSRFEGFPMACLETAAVGCVQLVTPGTNLCGAVTDFNAGIVAPSVSVNAISLQLEAFDSLLSDRAAFLTKRFNAWNMAMEYSWDNISNRIIHELYEL